MTLSIREGINGFENGQDDSTLSYDRATRTVTLTPTPTGTNTHIKVFVAGRPFFYDTPQTATHPDVSGLYAFIIDDTGVMQALATAAITEDIILRNALVAIVYWNAEQDREVLFGDERHGLMDSESHAHFHKAIGAQIQRDSSEGAFRLLGIDMWGGGDFTASAQIAMEAGTLLDEDVELRTDTTGQVLGTPAASNPLDNAPIAGAVIPTIWRGGANGIWYIQDDTASTGTGAKTADVVPLDVTVALPTYTGALGDRHPWNEFTGATWQLTEPGSNDKILIHLFAWNDVNTRIVAVVGQNTYSGTSEARDGAAAELLNLVFDDIPLPEFRPLYTLILGTNVGFNNESSGRWEPVDNFSNPAIDWRFAFGGQGGGVTGGPAGATTFAALTDTNVVGVATGDVLYWDGADWTNLAIGAQDEVLTVSAGGLPEWAAAAGGGGEANTASNLGAGSGVFAQKTGVDLEFLSLVGGNGITLATSATELTIARDAIDVSDLDDVNLTGPAAGDTLYFNGTNWVNLSIGAAGEVLTVNAGATAPEWAAGGGGGETNTASNLGAGEGIFAQKTGVDLEFKSLVGGAGITLSSTATELTIDTSAELNTGASLGAGNAVFAGKVGAELQFKSLVAGTNVTITNDANTITINSTGGGGGATTFDALTDTNIGATQIGDTLYWDGTDWVNLVAGAAGTVLRSGGPGFPVSWVNPGTLSGVTLQAAYDNGSTIALAAATPVEITAGAGDFALELTGKVQLETATDSVVIGNTLTDVDGNDCVYVGNNIDGNVGNFHYALGNDITFTGTSSAVAIGNTITASEDSVVIGVSASAPGSESTVIGRLARTTGTASAIRFNTVVGYNASVNDADSGVAIGRNAAILASSDDSVAIGSSAAVRAGVTSGIAIGTSADVVGNKGIAIGEATNADGTDAISIGRLSVAGGTESIALGHGTNAPLNHSVVIGGDASGTGGSSVAVGRLSVASGTDAVALGRQASAADTNAVAVGPSCNASLNGTIAIGASATASAGQATAIGNAPTASGALSIAIGTSAEASGDDAIAIGGTGVSATQLYAIAIGRNADATAADTIAIGRAAAAAFSNSIALGQGANASATNAVAIGFNSDAVGNDSFAVGRLSDATGPGAVALGLGTTAGDSSVAIGETASAAGTDAIAIGLNAGANNNVDIAIGRQAFINAGSNVSIALGFAARVESVAGGVSSIDSVAIGRSALVQGSDGLAIGNAAKVLPSDGEDGTGISDNSTAVGRAALTQGSNNSAFGVSATATGGSATAIGALTDATGASSVAMGDGAQAVGASSLAIGPSASASDGAAVAIGPGATIASGGAASVALGNGALAPGLRSVAIGRQSNASATVAVSIGNQSAATGTNCVALGHSTQATGTDATAIGTSASATGAYSTVLGQAATDGGFSNAICIGEGAEVTGSGGIAIGRGASATGGRFVVGSNAQPVSIAWIGKGEENASPSTNVFLRTTSAAAGSGADGSNLVLQAGEGDGAGTDGYVELLSAVQANSSVGTAGQLLTSRGAGLSPEWTTVAGVATTLQDAYDNGRSISVSTANTPVQITAFSQADPAIAIGSGHILYEGPHSVRIFSEAGSPLTNEVHGQNATGIGNGIDLTAVLTGLAVGTQVKIGDFQTNVEPADCTGLGSNINIQHDYCIALGGVLTSTKAGQVLIGHQFGGTEFVFGQGAVSNFVATNVLLKTTDGQGTDNGSNLQIQAGLGTGTGSDGYIELLSALQVNSSVGSAGQFLESRGAGQSPVWREPSYAGIFAGSTENVIINAPTTYVQLIGLNQVAAGRNSNPDTSNSRITAGQTGDYVVSYSISALGTEGNSYRVAIAVNGNTRIASEIRFAFDGTTAFTETASCSTLTSLNAGDNVTLVVQNIGATNNLSVTEAQLNIVRID